MQIWLNKKQYLKDQIKLVISQNKEKGERSKEENEKKNREKNTWTKNEIMYSIAESMDFNRVVENIKNNCNKNIVKSNRRYRKAELLYIS